MNSSGNANDNTYNNVKVKENSSFSLLMESEFDKERKVKNRI